VKMTLQRSIPFPRIGVDKLIGYLTYIKDNGPVEVGELKEAGLDFGKGRGDITRFFEKLGLVAVQGNLVSLTGEGEKLVDRVREYGIRVLHEYLFNELPQYRLLVSVLRELGSASEDELLSNLNKRLADEFPAAWVNRVALRSMLGILQDLGMVVKVNGAVTYIDGDAADPLECLRRLSIQVSEQYLVSLRELSNCLGRVLNPSALSECGVLITAPNDTMLRFSSFECLVKLLRAY